MGDLFDRLLGGRQADTQQRLLSRLLQALERQREVRAAPRADHRMDLVDDDRAHGAQDAAAAFGRQQQIERLGRRDENVRRRPQHRRAFRLRRVPCAHRRRHARRFQPLFFGEAANAATGLREILVDVRAQRLERRDVDDADFIGQRAGEPVPDEVVERCQKGGERLARSSRRGDERVPPVADRRPALRLRPCRLAECFGKPAGDDRMEQRERHHG